MADKKRMRYTNADKRMILDWMQYSLDMFAGWLGVSDGAVTADNLREFLDRRREAWDASEFQGHIAGEEKMYAEDLPTLRKLYKRMHKEPGYDLGPKKIVAVNAEAEKKYRQWQRSPAGRKAARKSREAYKAWRKKKLAEKKRLGQPQRITERERTGYWMMLPISRCLDYRGIMRRAFKITPIDMKKVCQHKVWVKLDNMIWTVRCWRKKGHKGEHRSDRCENKAGKVIRNIRWENGCLTCEYMFMHIYLEKGKK